MLEWLDREGRLRREGRPWGIIPGEAAAFGLLARRGFATRRRVPCLAAVMGLGLGSEPTAGAEGRINLGRGLTEAWRAALRPLGKGVQISDIFLDCNAEPWRADEHGMALLRCRKSFVSPSTFWAPVDAWGDVGAATGVLLTQLAIAAHQRNYARGGHAFVSTSSDGGERAAVTLGYHPAT